jgi:spore coat assemly protein
MAKGGGWIMPLFKPGDIVSRKSYSGDIFFKVTGMDKVGKNINLKGLNVRLIADAPPNDLNLVSSREVYEYSKDFSKITHDRVKKMIRSRWRGKGSAISNEKGVGQSEFFEVPGRVLHLDGDEEYLDECLKTYRQLNINAKGLCYSEKEQPKVLSKVLRENPTDILVLTGHDGLLKGCKDFACIESYRSSKYFIESVTIARAFEPNRDSLVIFAGACQSHYEAILQAGANFASSPKRILIHAFDPVFIVERVAFTPIYETVSLKDIIDNTVTGTDGVGGLETRGQLRLGYPRSPY